MRRSASSNTLHMPLALAASMAARPAGCMSPSDSSCSTRCLFDADQGLFGVRRVNHIMVRSSSTVLACPSIHPTASASSTCSS